jgi:hypothetical protein
MLDGKGASALPSTGYGMHMAQAVIELDTLTVTRLGLLLTVTALTAVHFSLIVDNTFFSGVPTVYRCEDSWLDRAPPP